MASWWRRTAVVATLAVGTAVLQVPPGAAAPVESSLIAAPRVAERPDRVSAMVTAVAQGARVEDVSARTPSTGLFANPDGSWTLESFAGVVRSETEPGKWVPVDPTVATSDGGFEPAAVPFDVEFAGGGTREIASVTSPDGGEFTVRAPAKLRNPDAVGDQVRYEISEPGDVVVRSLPNGFNFSVELDAAPAADAEPLEYRFPLSISKGKFVERKNGSIDIVSDGVVVASMSIPLMWDSADEPVPVPVATSLEGTGSERELVLRPDAQYLADPARVYPVTVDPTVVLTATGDTWVQSGLLANNNSQYDSPELRVGTNNLGVNKARSYVNFDVSSIEAGSDVVDAKVALTNFTAGSCSGSQIRMSQITEAWSVTDITWSTQPATTATGSSATDVAYGASACPEEGVVEFDATQIAQSWLDGTANHGVQFKADQEGQNASWRKYQSLENGDTAKAPKLTVTFNQRPATPTSVTVDPGTGGWARSKGPELSAVVTDPDGGQVAGYFEIHDGSSVVWSDTSALVPSGGTASVQVPAGTLIEGHEYWVWVRGEDELGLRSKDKAWKFIKVDTIAPTVTITSDTFTNDTWTTTIPSSSTLTLTGTSDTSGFYFTYNGVTTTIKANSSGVGEITYTPKAGWHTFSVVPVDFAGNAGDAVTFQYGTGPGSFSSPSMWAPSTASFPINASAPPNATSAGLEWRRYGETTWRTAQKVELPDGTAWTGAVTELTGRSTTGELVWHATEEPDGTGTLKPPGLLEIRSCFDYSGGSQSCTDKVYVGLHVTAFGDRRPVADLGPAQVALTSGEALIFETDAVDSRAGLGRSFSSLSDGTLGEGVFGPGWSDAQILAPLDDAAASVIDNRTVDGTFVILDAAGGSQIFTPTSAGANTYEPAQPTGDATTLTLIPGVDGAPDTLELSRPLGTGTVVTTWEWSTSDTGEDDGWVVKKTDAPGTENDLAVASDHQRPTWIRESDPNAASTCNATTQTLGCRGLKITYTGTGSATRVSEVHKVIGADAPTTPTTDLLASYTYTSGNLTKVCGPVPAAGEPPLCSEYTYTTAAGRTMLATMKPAGLTEWRFEYDNLGRLKNVKREKPEGGDAVWSVDYSLSTTATGLPDMTASKIAEWGQQTVPTKVYAVYQPHTGTTDVTKAQLYYTAGGLTTNTATYGPDGWLVDTGWYDTRGNLVQHLDGTGWARVQAAPAADRPQVALEASSFTEYNTWGDADTIGTRVVDEYGPAHTATLEDGTTGYYRTHTTSTYDDDPNVDPALIADRPGTEGLGLVVKETTSTATADRTADHDQKVTKYGYAPTVSGDADGWELGTPTTTSVKVDGSTWGTATTRHDTEGRMIETRQPGGGADASGAGNDAHSTTVTYYTADGTGDCGGKPAWDGLVCKQGPAAQPAGTTMPVTHYATYNTELQPTLVREVSGGTVNRTTTTDYDKLGRPTSSTVETNGTGVAADSISTSFGYSTATGQPTTVAFGGDTVATSYDSWGRQSGYTDATGNTAATTYDAAGRIATQDDGATTSTYAYDDHGYLSSVAATGGIGTFSYNLDVTGFIEKVIYPNGIVANFQRDEVGNPTGTTYAVGGTTLLAFSASIDAVGRTLAQASPASAQQFSYDGAGRLTRAEDTRDGACTTRTYGFSPASERTAFNAYGPTAEGGCQTNTASASRASTYDTANRITNSGYTYDTLGRTLTVPAAETALGASSDLTATYRANDMVAALTQDVDGDGATETRQVSYTLDPAGRIGLITNESDGLETSRSRYRYGNTSDSPTSIETSTDAGTNWTSTVYISLPALGLAATAVGDVAQYQIANPHGDIVATADAAGSLANYNESDEYGNPIESASAPNRYGWLGIHQRSTDAAGGLVLMGVRLYNPSTGVFLSDDPVHGGNLTRYGYPVDPINHLDLDGQICWFGKGRCTRTFPRYTGYKVRVLPDTWDKVTGYHKVPGWLVGRAIYHAQRAYYPSNYTPYKFTVWEWECRGRKCRRTNKWRNIYVVINWLDGKRGRGTLKTMYCKRPGPKTCDDWIQNAGPYLGPPGPQM